MEKKLNIALRQQMNVDDMPGLGDIPPLGERARKLIAERKRENNNSETFASSFLDQLFGRYKFISLTFCVIGIISAINFLMTFDISAETGNISALQPDTTLTVSSNTYLATLNQSTIAETPANNTSTALTSISTFMN